MEDRKGIQPFKTISLTDKLKGSIYDKDFGKTTKSQPAKLGTPLKELLPQQPKESVILKKLADSPQLTSPRIRSQFASSISLADRLDQPNTAKTTHLAQYFLSDLYTGYLTISPFLTAAIDATQNTTTTQEQVSVSQILKTQDPNTQLTARISDKTTLIAQGTFFNEGAFESLTDPENRVSDDTILIGQGTRFSNNQFISFIEALPNTAVVNQGSIELPIWNPTAIQGLTVEESEPADVNSIAVLQGMFLQNGIIEGSVLENNVFQTITLENSPTPAISIFQTATLENFTIPTLDILSYETDRLLAFATPKIKQGSADLSVSQFLENRTEAVNNPTEFHGTVVTEQVQLNPNDKLAQTPAVDSTSTPGDKNNESSPESDSIGGDQYNNGNPAGDGILRNIDGGIGQSGNINGTVGSLAAYRSIAYGGLLPGAFSNKDPNQKSGGANAGISPMEAIGGVTPGAEIGDFTDFVDIKFTHNGKFLKLKSYLTAYSDGFSANWNDVQYVGRQDTLKQFAGVTRAVSFAVLLPSFSKADIAVNMKKLNLLAGMTVVGGFKPGANYITGPLCKLKIGNLIDAYCAFSSLKWDFDPAEATFDIDEGMPHMLKVSLDATVLADGDDKLLNGTNGNYFGKKY